MPKSSIKTNNKLVDTRTQTERSSGSDILKLWSHKMELQEAEFSTMGTSEALLPDRYCIIRQTKNYDQFSLRAYNISDGTLLWSCMEAGAVYYHDRLWSASTKFLCLFSVVQQSELQEVWVEFIDMRTGVRHGDRCKLPLNQARNFEDYHGYSSVRLDRTRSSLFTYQNGEDDEIIIFDAYTRRSIKYRKPDAAISTTDSSGFWMVLRENNNSRYSLPRAVFVR